jgi:hypothetical protein
VTFHFLFLMNLIVERTMLPKRQPYKPYHLNGTQ